MPEEPGEKQLKKAEEDIGVLEEEVADLASASEDLANRLETATAGLQEEVEEEKEGE